LPCTLSLPDPACTPPSTSLSLTSGGNPQRPAGTSAPTRPHHPLHHLTPVPLVWSSGRARRHGASETCSRPPALTLCRCTPTPVALSFRRTSGRPPAPSRLSSLSHGTTRASVQTAAPPRSLAPAPPLSTNRLLPPFLRRCTDRAHGAPARAL
jgi:hypothetical protein